MSLLLSSTLFSKLQDMILAPRGCATSCTAATTASFSSKLSSWHSPA